jgi:hypothetical protein
MLGKKARRKPAKRLEKIVMKNIDLFKYYAPKFKSAYNLSFYSQGSIYKSVLKYPAALLLG